VYSTERTLGEHGSKLAEGDRKAVDDALAEAREALKGEDLERMKRAQETLTHAAHKLAEVMYQAQAQPGAPSGGPAGDGHTAGPKEGEVVDAEFEDLGDKKGDKK
jgi:molecular chaperone DnaK